MGQLRHNKTLINDRELQTKKLLKPVLEMLGKEYSVFTQVGVSALINPDQFTVGGKVIPDYKAKWSQCMNGRVDFVVCEGESDSPLFVMEYDSPMHDSDPRKVRNDLSTNWLFREAGLPLVRIRRADLESPPADLRTFLSSMSAPAKFIQYAAWYLSVYMGIERIIASLSESDLSSDHFYRYLTYYWNLRDDVLLDFRDPKEVIQESKEELTKVGGWGNEVYYFQMMYGSAPEFEFRRIGQGIDGKAMYEKRSFHNPAATIKAYGIDQAVLDKLILSYHVRALLGCIATTIEERNRANPDKNAAERVARQRVTSEKQRRKRRERAAAMGTLPEQTDYGDESDTKYGPNELQLFPDKKIREDLRKYAWRWDRFFESSPRQITE